MGIDWTSANEARRCTATATTTGSRCQRAAIKGGKVCIKHGGKAPQVRAKADQRLAAEKVTAGLAREGVTVQPGQDPYEVLDRALSRLVALQDRLGGIVDRIADESLRYEGRAGEQARAELVLYRQVLTDTAAVAERISKLGLAERRIRLQETTVLLLAQAVRGTLQQLGVDVHDPRIGPILVAQLRQLDAQVTGPAYTIDADEAPALTR